MLAALIVSGWPKLSRRPGFEFDAFKIAVEGKIEVEASLLAIGNDVQSSRELIMNCHNHGVFLQLSNVSWAEGIQVLAGKLQPSRKRIASNDGCAQWSWLHGSVPQE